MGGGSRSGLGGVWRPAEAGGLTCHCQLPQKSCFTQNGAPIRFHVEWSRLSNQRMTSCVLVCLCVFVLACITKDAACEDVFVVFTLALAVRLCANIEQPCCDHWVCVHVLVCVRLFVCWQTSGLVSGCLQGSTFILLLIFLMSFLASPFSPCPDCSSSSSSQRIVLTAAVETFDTSF